MTKDVVAVALMTIALEQCEVKRDDGCPEVAKRKNTGRQINGQTDRWLDAVTMATAISASASMFVPSLVQSAVNRKCVQPGWIMVMPQRPGA